ncbi:MAG: MBOAT family protein [Methylococcales bacterium]|nr:MBOAT family protein [Methylococcales bacterium]
MLFNTPEFLYFFLPFSIAAWWFLQRLGREKLAQMLVIISSVYFYGWWDMRYVPLLIGNAVFNFYLGQTLAKTKSKALLVAGLAYNIGLLGYFKYADFFIENWNALSGGHNPPLHLILPLGLSFFTFQVIAYLVDCYKGYVSDFNLRRFAFSISFYPHLIAGPILHYADVMPQLRDRTTFDAKQFSQGLTLFAVGLFKKSVIADRIAETVDPLFAANTVLQFFESWVAAIGYGLQIYFDFSGYSDMAIGVGLMFGILLPQNFNSPYQATSIADFWQRWHMTLSRFLRDYVYIPLGGNRKGFSNSLFAAGITMIIGGFWHGAAWTFVLWGVLHGVFIGINRIWRQTGNSLPEPYAIALTFLSVTVAWVVFRAESVDQALSVWQGMIGANGFAIPSAVSGICQTCTQTTLITGMELVQGSILLAICLEYANAQKAVQQLEPNFKTLAYFTTLFFTSIWLAGSHESFIYWQF